MSFASEFKEFAVKGNVVDLAVGVIIGGAFGKIIDSVVNDLVMPVAGRVLGGVDFANYFIALRELPPGIAPTLEAVRKAGVPVIAWGQFFNVAVNFALLALVIFVMVKQVNRLRAPPPSPAAPPAPPAPPEDVVLLREIRDSLRSRS